MEIVSSTSLIGVTTFPVSGLVLPLLFEEFLVSPLLSELLLSDKVPLPVSVVEPSPP